MTTSEAAQEKEAAPVSETAVSGAGAVGAGVAGAAMPVTEHVPSMPTAEPTADRTVFLLAHTGRPAAIRSAELVVQGLLRSGIGVRVLAAEAADLPLPPAVERVDAGRDVLNGLSLIHI